MPLCRTAPVRVAALALLMTLLCAGEGVASAPSHGAAESSDGEADSGGAVRVGRFDVRDHRPIEGLKLRVGFMLYFEGAPERAAQLRKLVKSHEHRVRHEVIVAVRMCEQHDFEEPELERFRRRILARLRRALPALGVERVLIAEYEYFVK